MQQKIHYGGRKIRPNKEIEEFCASTGTDKIYTHDFDTDNAIIFCMEKTSAHIIEKEKVSPNNNFYSLTYQFDYVYNYDLYSKYVKNIIFPSRFFIENCKNFINDKRFPTKWSEEKINSPKNIFLGSPKYDTSFCHETIREKYNLSPRPKVLFLFPATYPTPWKTKHRRGLSSDEINTLYRSINKLGFEVLVKSRLKHPIIKECHGDRYFYDDYWNPHVGMELMEISDLVISIDSSAAEECVMLNKPFINIALLNPKASSTSLELLGPLYGFNYAVNYNNTPNAEEFEKSITYLTTTNFSSEFEESRDKYLCAPGESSKKIADFILSKGSF